MGAPAFMWGSSAFKPSSGRLTILPPALAAGRDSSANPEALAPHAEAGEPPTELRWKNNWG
jgi:hypothetical protein